MSGSVFLDIPTLPLLDHIGDSTKDWPKGIIVAAALHVFPDLVPFLGSFKGVNPTNIYLTGATYTWKTEIADKLSNTGVNIYDPNLEGENTSSCVKKILLEIDKAVRKGNSKFLIVEDGGYLVPLLHKEFQNLVPFCYGAVEQTTNGINRDRGIPNLGIHVTSIPDSKTKQDLEPIYIARSVVRNLETDLRSLGKSIDLCKTAIIGYGPIGANVVNALRRLSPSIKPGVYDNDDYRQKLAFYNGCETIWDKSDMMENYDVIIGATGSTIGPPIGATEIDHAKNQIVLLSASSKQVEIDLAYLKETSVLLQDTKIWTKYRRRNDTIVYVLYDGQPVDFQPDGPSPLPPDIVDQIYSLMLDSADQLIKNTQNIGMRPPDYSREKDLSKMFLRIYNPPSSSQKVNK